MTRRLIWAMSSRCGRRVGGRVPACSRSRAEAALDLLDSDDDEPDQSRRATLTGRVVARGGRRHGQGACSHRQPHAHRALHRRRHAGERQARRAGPVLRQAGERRSTGALVEGRRVRLRIGRERTDRYGRLLAYVYRAPARRPVRQRRARARAATRARWRSRRTPTAPTASPGSSAAPAAPAAACGQRAT